MRRIRDGVTRPSRRHRSLYRRAAEAGAATIEATAMTIVAALLALGLLLAVTPQARHLAQTLAYQICVVVTFGQGGCTPPSSSVEAREPTEPCVVSQDGVERNQKIAAVIFTTSDGRRIEVQELSNGDYRVTVSDSEGAGAEIGVGGGLSITVADRTVGGSAVASAGASIDVKSGEVYHASPDTIEGLMDALLDDQIKDTIAGDSGPIRWLADRASGLVGLDGELPEPDEVYAEGGVTLNASAEATAVGDSARAGVDLAQVLGVKRARDGTSTVYLQTTVSGSAGLQSLGVDTDGPGFRGAGLEGEVQVVTAVTFDKDGTMIRMQVSSVTSGTASGFATALFGGSGDASLATQESQANVFQASLDLEDAADHAVAQQFLLAQGVAALGAWDNPLAAAGLIGASQNFFEAAGERGTMTQQVYDTDASTVFAFDASGRLGVELGAAADVRTDSMDIVGAQYWDGTQWVDWEDCAA